MDAANFINLGTLIGTAIGLFITYWALKKDNRKSNKETIESAIIAKVNETKEFMELERRVALLEQKSALKDDIMTSELAEIKSKLNYFMKKLIEED